MQDLNKVLDSSSFKSALEEFARITQIGHYEVGIGVVSNNGEHRLNTSAAFIRDFIYVVYDNIADVPTDYIVVYSQHAPVEENVPVGWTHRKDQPEFWTFNDGHNGSMFLVKFDAAIEEELEALSTACTL